jgi:large subunit ribosomal protein L24
VRSAAGLVVQARKKWETQPTNPATSKPVLVKVHVKKGDKVKVISGGDKGTVSEVLQVFRKTGYIKVKDVNVKTKHVKPRQEGESGQIQKMEAPIHHSQVQPVTADGQPSRIRKEVVDGKKTRVLVKTGERLA